MTDGEPILATYRVCDIDRARALWAAAVDALGEPQREKLGRLADRDGAPIAIVAEYLGAMAASLSKAELDQVRKDVTRLSAELGAALAGLDNLGRAVQIGRNELGENVWGAVAFAQSHMRDAAASANQASRALDAIEDAVGGLQVRGKGGVAAKLRDHSPQVSLAIALGKLWRAQGLTLNGGHSGDGVDHVLASIVEGVDQTKDPRGSRKWLEVLMADVRRELSQYPG